MLNLPKLLTPEQTAEILGVTVATLATWRCTKRVPLNYVKTGRLIRYREADVLAFIEARTQTIT